MKKLIVTALLVLCGLDCAATSAESPFPRLLPLASELHLTLREDPHSSLALGPSCGGEASRTLTCRAFTIILKNTSVHTIHLSGLTCAELSITIEMREPRSSNGWWPVSQPIQSACATLTWTNLRLKPGESTQYATRIITPRRQGAAFVPGTYILRANWTLFGCTDAPGEHDCLTLLQVFQKASSVPDVDIQEPVTVVSNEVTASSPHLGDLGSLRFTFDVTARPGVPSDADSGLDPRCLAETSASIHCTVFHYIIRNLGDRAVRNTTFSCSHSGITPEHRVAGGEWKPLPGLPWECSANISIEREILPGGKVEGEFLLEHLAPGFDTTPLRPPGEYELRFTFNASACFASPDAKFCLMRPEKQPSVLSNEVTVSTK